MAGAAVSVRPATEDQRELVTLYKSLRSRTFSSSRLLTVPNPRCRCPSPSPRTEEMLIVFVVGASASPISASK
ncbi:hypothetical protein BDN71DRAFT_1447884 [Pleurotus eryngii]|uniref:Uncharacterized protein n=1 Tax=Pleurotus eryngii TaxID=5323 RepID=A0A9P6DFE9_PLEER|nr:hypothetical protein BDN71DRAFT_1447884 [Pleurotus eryngii]